MKKSPPLIYTFENPNSPSTFEEAFKKIILEKLLTGFAYPEALPARSNHHENCSLLQSQYR